MGRNRRKFGNKKKVRRAMKKRKPYPPKRKRKRY
jgi:hypothetical protein|tara:strand:- start:3469 stop:3570 length:102 start_codon:yes stop_codon:yes gene_type:complete